MTGLAQASLSILKLRFLTACVALTPLSGLAQETEDQGKIIYDQTINLHAALSPDQAALKALVPKERTVRIEAAFAGDRFSLRTLPADPSDQTVQIRIGSNGDVTIVDLGVGEQIRVGELAGFKFANRSDLAELDGFTQTGNVRAILGYEARELTGSVTVNGEERATNIWYTDALPAGLSPFPLKGLPGAVLELKIGEDFWRYSAAAIESTETDLSLFEIPEGHREISDGQLQDLQEEALDALRQSGAVVSRTR